MIKKIERCLEFHNPMCFSKEGNYKFISEDLSLILHHCYNETDIQFKLYEIISDNYLDSDFEIPPRKSLYLVSKDLWQIKQESL